MASDDAPSLEKLWLEGRYSGVSKKSRGGSVMQVTRAHVIPDIFPYYTALCWWCGFFCKVAALSPEAGPEPRRGDSQRQAGACAQRRARVHGMSWRHNCHASSAAPPDGDKNRDLNNYAALVFKSYSSGIRPYSEVFAVYSGFSLLLTLCVY